MSGRILITGAHGFIGAPLTRHLREAGYPVVACARQARGIGEDAVTGDLACFDGWDALLSDVDTVLHLAGRAHQTRERATREVRAAYEAANVTATQRLIAAASRQSKPPHLVLVSTIAALGQDSGNRPFAPEDDHRLGENPQARLSPYGASKYRAEQALKASGLPWTIVRLPLVYGPGVRANFRRLIRLVACGVPLPFAAVRNQRSLCYLENAVEGLHALIRARAALSAEVVHLADAHAPATPELIRALASALGQPARLWPCPPAVLAAAARLSGQRQLYAKLCGNLALATASSYRRLGWAPRYRLEEGLEAWGPSLRETGA